MAVECRRSPPTLSNIHALRLYNLLRRRAPALLRAALPQACALCAAACGGALLCDECTLDLPRMPPACPVCALPSPAAAVCGACLRRPPPYSAAIAAFAYAFPLDRLVQGLKYRGQLAFAGWLGAALAAAVRARGDAWPDVVVAVPLAPARQRERGFNQTTEIARGVARDLELPLAEGLRRVRDGPPQAGLARTARIRNLRHAFAADAAIAGKRVAIIDDVMTSGTTLAAATGALLRAGAAGVEAWVVARTLR